MVCAPTAAYMEGPEDTHGVSISWQFYMTGQCPCVRGGPVLQGWTKSLRAGVWSLDDDDISEDHIFASLHSIEHKFKSGDEIELSINVEIRTV
ncbi:hypothetical protein SLA2020_364660 [Shorea laevis]